MQLSSRFATKLASNFWRSPDCTDGAFVTGTMSQSRRHGADLAELSSRSPSELSSWSFRDEARKKFPSRLIKQLRGRWRGRKRKDQKKQHNVKTSGAQASPSTRPTHNHPKPSRTRLRQQTKPQRQPTISKPIPMITKPYLAANHNRTLYVCTRCNPFF